VVTLWRVTIFMKKMKVIVLTHDTKRPNKQYISRIMMITVIFGCWCTSLRRFSINRNYWHEISKLL